MAEVTLEGSLHLGVLTFAIYRGPLSVDPSFIQLDFKFKISLLSTQLLLN